MFAATAPQVAPDIRPSVGPTCRMHTRWPAATEKDTHANQE